jgi:hypothetical protein
MYTQAETSLLTKPSEEVRGSSATDIRKAAIEGTVKIAMRPAPGNRQLNPTDRMAGDCIL